ncbi:amidohydrolase [Dyadobacter sediminis]|uniref:Omega-amidase YafV n=1 Tax=Dyadobacter sediminis TaxID=1493691 RepID=A0A5R9K729_9BACT|nr:amidohydrolase [Dyadobacter sediminis]TLU89589.1 amidohydrolase [Dyadobacter sediminis]GGC04091.1 carbon-nitrogen hydrolase [Dyadobacter sediminis]
MTSVEEHKTLSAALIQTDIFWEDVTANLAALEEKIAALEESVDIIVLPEMFNSGFTMNTAVAEPMGLTTTRWMKQIAMQTKALTIGSFAVKENGKFFNRLFCVYPDGTYLYNDKRHLFSFGKEHETYTPGNSRLILEWKGWKICPLVCYDLRFPVWSRNSLSHYYDLLIYIANWPAKRSHAWNTLLQARAIENQSYVIGVNRTGTDGMGLEYKGDSTALDYLGEPICMLSSAETEKVAHFSKPDLLHYRETFPALKDADTFHVTVE